MKQHCCYQAAQGPAHGAFRAGSSRTTSGSNIYYQGGNVGIGTANPQYALDVNGTSHLGPDESTLPAVLHGAARGSGPSPFLITYDGGGSPNTTLQIEAVSNNAIYAANLGGAWFSQAIEGDDYAGADGQIAVGFNSYASADGFAADSLVGVWIDHNGLNDALGGSAVNNYGIYVDDQTFGTNNYAIKTGLGKVELGDALKLDQVAFASIGTCNGPAAGTIRAVNNSTTNTLGATITGGGPTLYLHSAMVPIGL